MSRPAWQQQALAAARREAELRRGEERERAARYYHTHARRSQHHEAWTASAYYERANRQADQLGRNKIKAAQLEERRKKLEMMLFQENLQLQEELKSLSSRPKLFKNGSYLNNVPTSTLKDINQGIQAKEEQLRRQEAELRLYHAWRARQPEVRAADSLARRGALKSAWMEQVVEKEMQKKKEEEETKRVLRERDEYLKRQIALEQEREKEKQLQMEELRTDLQGQIAELGSAERAVRALRLRGERAASLLAELRDIAGERARGLARLAAERSAAVLNMGLHKHRLKTRALAVRAEIQWDVDVLQRLREAAMKDCVEEKEKEEEWSKLLEQARRTLEEHREQERQRLTLLDSMFDGEARQLQHKQDQLWAKEREARKILMEEVSSTLQRQLEERLEENRRQQQLNVLEREQILEDVDRYHQEVLAKEREKQVQESAYGGVTALQSELNGLRLQQARLQEAEARGAAVREALLHEELLRRELVRVQRDGAGDLPPARRRVAW